MQFVIFFFFWRDFGSHSGGTIYVLHTETIMGLQGFMSLNLKTKMYAETILYYVIWNFHLSDKKASLKF